jgi:signal transduction histidine kinase
MLSFAFFAIFYFGYWHHDLNQTDYDRFEEKFQSLETESSDYLENLATLQKPPTSLFASAEPHDFLETFIYRNDSLKYWSTNSISVPSFWDGEVEDGVHFIQNGWYNVQSRIVDQTTFIVVFPIKKEFPYENTDLKNEFLSYLDFPYDATVSKSAAPNAVIHSFDDSIAFYLSIPSSKNQNPYFEFIALIAFLLSCLICYYVFLKTIVEVLPKNWILVLITGQLGLITLQLMSLHFGWFTFLSDFEIFDPILFASYWYMPSLGDVVVNISIIAFVAFSSHYMGKARLLRKNKWFSLFILPLYIVLLAFAFYITISLKSYVIDSSIPFSIDQLFSLNFYSFVIIGLIFLLFFSYFILARLTIQSIVQQNYPLNFFYLSAFLTSALYLVIYFYSGFDSLFGGIWPLIINALILIVERKLAGQYKFGIGVILLIVFSGYCSTSLTTYFEEKELNNRRSFAQKLISDEDPNTEFEYKMLSPIVEKSNFLLNLLYNPYSIPKSEFDQEIQKDIFNEYWGQYEISYYLFDVDSIPTINYRSAKGSDFESLDEIIVKHTEQSEITRGIYFVTDYYDKLSYVIKQQVLNKDQSVAGFLFCLLKSKKIPEEIGFPSLLINSDDQIMTEIQNYSMARYVKGKLLRKYGNFNYPLVTTPWMEQKYQEGSNVFQDGFDHFVLNQDQGNTIILTKEETTTLGFITTFSYLFAIFGLLLLIPIFIMNYQSGFDLARLSLTAKIQFVLLFFILVALLSFGFGSGTFIRKQYLSNSKDFIREKIGSVQTEVRQKLGSEETLKNEDLESYLEYILTKFSKVFVTDINLYSTDGDLLASSRPQIYNTGLLGKKIHTDAFAKMNLEQKSEFIHRENIGNLTYLSAYQPFRNTDGKILAYLNLQYFAQQNALETQISEFLVSIINVFILLLAASIILAIFITSWLTRPLKLIQQNISAVQLGRSNIPIDYSGNDEIGSLVEAYNTKVAELEENALQLAKSERESAWREMAKQVAHEIKNPLTPMKLSMQHFERSFDPQDPDAKERLERLSRSIIEQIDGLTTIANEFSNFAKMPKANAEVVDINEVLELCIELFQKSENCQLDWLNQIPESYVLADKKLLIRVFNNLLKNAVQSIPSTKVGAIEINISEGDGVIQISIHDNGIGIPEEQKEKIFVPNFTTKSAGSGLGLAMVKQIVEQANGEVHFTTDLGEGTTFYVSLPKHSET